MYHATLSLCLHDHPILKANPSNSQIPKAQMVVSYAIGTIVSGTFFLKETVLASRGIAGCLFKWMWVPSVFAFFFNSALALTRRTNSSLDRDNLTCSTRRLTRFSMYLC